MPSPLKTCARAKPLLGTRVEISAPAAATLELHRAFDAAFALITDIHRCMSAQEHTSDLAALHAAPVGAVVAVSVHTVTVLRSALRFATDSRGAFNPCLGAWQDFSAIEIVSDKALRRHAPLQIDLSGIAKGYAVDCAIGVLQAAGVPAALVNAGGDLRCYGDSAQRVGVRDPALPHRVATTLRLRDAALATSAPYFSPGALYDPQGRRSLSGDFSVSVVAPTCMAADALTKVALNAPPQLTQRLLAELRAEVHWLGARRAA